MGVDNAYFVVGETVSTYDIEQDKATDEWTLRGAWSGLPIEFAAGIDAAVDLGSFNLYVFRGGDYVRIPFGTQTVDDGYPAPIQGNWPGLSFDQVDAAIGQIQQAAEQLAARQSQWEETSHRLEALVRDLEAAREDAQPGQDASREQATAALTAPSTLK